MKTSTVARLSAIEKRNKIEFSLITCDREIEHVLQNISFPPSNWEKIAMPWWLNHQIETKSWGSLFISVGDGEYNQIWICETPVPWLKSEIVRIYPK